MIDRSTLAGFAAVLLWSSTVALSRSISEQVGPLVLGFTVYTTAGLLLAAANLFLKKRLLLPGKYLPFTLTRGALFLFYTLALYIALGRADGRLQAVEIGLLNYLWPSLTLLLSMLILGKRARAWLGVGTILGLGGILLVLTQGSAISPESFIAHIRSNPLSYSLGLMAALAWAAYSNLTTRWKAGASDWDIPLFMLATGLAFGMAVFLQGEQIAAGGRTTFEILLLAGFTAAGYLLWDKAMRSGKTVVVFAFSYLTPFFSTLVSAYYLQVAPGLQIWAGCALIIMGSLISWRSFTPQGHLVDSKRKPAAGQR